MQARGRGDAVAVFRGLYRGIGGNLLGVAPASALFFAAYEPMKTMLRRDDAGGGDGAKEHLLAGAVGGLVSSVVRVPTEVIKTRRQVGARAGAGLRSIVASSGVAGLFVGYGSFLLRDLPFDAIEFAGYESLKNAWRDVTGQDDVNGVEAAALGAIAGAFTGAATTPLDVVKTRLMTSPDVYHGVAHCVRKTIADEGALALFKGVQPRVLWIGLGGGCFFSVLETARAAFLPSRGDGETR
jgi:solute carrier family 25 S-adenosylmethionine transporter 26